MNKETLQQYSCLLQEYLVGEGMVLEWAIFLNVVVNCIIVFVGIFIIDVVFRKFQRSKFFAKIGFANCPTKFYTKFKQRILWWIILIFKGKIYDFIATVAYGNNPKLP